MPLPNLKNRRRSASPNGLADVKAIVAQATAAHPGGPLRLDAGRLTDEEENELVALGRQGWEDGYFQIGRLGKKARRFEELVETAAARPGLFAAQRAEEKATREFAQIGRIARRPGRRVDLHEEGSVTLTREWAFDWFDRSDPFLHVFHLGLLALLMAQWENGATVFRNATMEADGTIVLDRRIGIGQHLDNEERLARWIYDLEHLATNGFIVISQSGDYLRIKQGPRLQKIARRGD